MASLSQPNSPALVATAASLSPHSRSLPMSSIETVSLVDGTTKPRKQKRKKLSKSMQSQTMATQGDLESKLRTRTQHVTGLYALVASNEDTTLEPQPSEPSIIKSLPGSPIARPMASSTSTQTISPTVQPIAFPTTSPTALSYPLIPAITHSMTEKKEKAIKVVTSNEPLDDTSVLLSKSHSLPFGKMAKKKKSATELFSDDNPAFHSPKSPVTDTTAKNNPTFSPRTLLTNYVPTATPSLSRKRKHEHSSPGEPSSGKSACKKKTVKAKTAKTALRAAPTDRLQKSVRAEELDGESMDATNIQATDTEKNTSSRALEPEYRYDGLQHQRKNMKKPRIVDVCKILKQSTGQLDNEIMFAKEVRNGGMQACTAPQKATEDKAVSVARVVFPQSQLEQSQPVPKEKAASKPLIKYTVDEKDPSITVGIIHKSVVRIQNPHSGNLIPVDILLDDEFNVMYPEIRLRDHGERHWRVEFQKMSHDTWMICQKANSKVATAAKRRGNRGAKVEKTRLANPTKKQRAARILAQLASGEYKIEGGRPS